MARWKVILGTENGRHAYLRIHTAPTVRFVTHKTIFAARATLQTPLRRLLEEAAIATPRRRTGATKDFVNNRRDSRKDLPRRLKISDRETSLTRFEIVARRNIGERGKTNTEGEEEREAGLDTSKRVHPDLELGAPPNTPLGTSSDSKRELFES